MSTSVVLEHYVVEQDQELRQSSNRTYERIAASLPSEVACRYGYASAERDLLTERLQEAVEVSALIRSTNGQFWWQADASFSAGRPTRGRRLGQTWRKQGPFL